MAGFVEYVGADEEESLLIACDLNDFNKHCAAKAYTHIELHGVAILGLCALDVPFANHSQAPRISYQVAISIS